MSLLKGAKCFPGGTGIPAPLTPALSPPGRGGQVPSCLPSPWKGEGPGVRVDGADLPGKQLELDVGLDRAALQALVDLLHLLLDGAGDLGVQVMIRGDADVA